MKSTRTIIFESGFTGHRSEYIKHLMKFINKHDELHGKYIFLLNHGIKDFLGVLVDSENYFIVYFDDLSPSSNSIRRTFKQWDFIAELIKRLSNINEIIFMEIDQYLLLISLRRFKKYKLNVRGILFQPYLHLVSIKPRSFYIQKQWIKNFLFQTYFLKSNRRIKKIYILNDRSTVEDMNSRIAPVFSLLPDPISVEEFDNKEDLLPSVSKKFGITGDQIIVLVFGSIDERKNLISIIDALCLLEDSLRNKIHLVIAGPFTKNVRRKYPDYIQKHSNMLKISYNNSFIKGQEREALFNICDLVLMPYRNFYSASSVLGHSIAHSKPIIAPKAGLLGRIVKSECLGVNVDPSNISEIRDAVERILTGETKIKYDSKQLLNNYSTKVFCQEILL